MEQPPPIVETPPPPAPKAPPTSLIARLLNVFAVPGDVFEEVKEAPPTAANWLVPALIASVVGAVSVWIVLAQPAIQQQIREKQDHAIGQKLEKAVQAGKLTRQQADQERAAAEKFMGPTLMKISGTVGAFFFSFVRVFLWGLVLWVIGLWWLKVRFNYLKAVEIAGLAGMIGVLGAIVTLLLKVNFSNPSSSPSLALAVGDFDPKNPLHLLLAAVNLFDVWQLWVMAVGLARLAGVPFFRAGFPLFGLWLIWSSVWISIISALGRLAG
jgi:Yip1 domain